MVGNLAVPAAVQCSIWAEERESAGASQKSSAGEAAAMEAATHQESGQGSLLNKVRSCGLMMDDGFRWIWMAWNKSSRMKEILWSYEYM